MARSALVDKLQVAVINYQLARIKIAAGEYTSITEAEVELREARLTVCQIEDDLVAFDRSFRDP